MGVVAAAGEAPLLHLVEHLDLLLGVPRLGRDVDAVHERDFFLVSAARVAVARAGLGHRVD